MFQLVALFLAAVCALSHTDVVTLYETTSVSEPFKLTERGKITFNGSVRNATFEGKALAIDDPQVYRIGTQSRLGSISNPRQRIDALNSVQEKITIFLDNEDELYNVQYELREGSGTLVAVDCLVDSTEPGPILKKAIDIANTSTGEEVVVAEKSFLQKYWIYLIPLAVVFLIGGPGPEEKE